MEICSLINFALTREIIDDHDNYQLFKKIVKIIISHKFQVQEIRIKNSKTLFEPVR